MFNLSKIMILDRDRAKQLMRECPEVATEKINALGYDFTVEEVSKYANIARHVILGTQPDDCAGDVYGGLAQGDELDVFNSLINLNWGSL